MQCHMIRLRCSHYFFVSMFSETDHIYADWIGFFEEWGREEGSYKGQR